MFRLKLLLGALAVAGVSFSGVAQVNVVTFHNDNGRTGANLNESILTPSNVKSATFGKLFTYNVDGYVYAQPLYVSGLNIPGQGIHNAVFVATEHNTIYCLDGDSNTGTNGGVLWQVNLGPAAPCPVDGFRFLAITNEVGITGTPVIDPVSQTLYVDAFTSENGTYVHRIHALNLADGSEKPFSPVVVSASVPGNGAGSSGGVLPFQAGQELQRSALTLAGGVVYVAYAGYTDLTTTDPFHGWIIGFDASNLQLLTDHIFVSTPNGTSSQFGAIAGEGGIWMGGGGPAVDSNTNLYFATGDGNFNANVAGGTEYGSSVIKLSTTNGLSAADYFTSYNQQYYQANDLDVGSGGVMLLPDQPGTYPHLMVAGGKPQYAYLLNRDQMTTDNGHYNSGGTSDNILQSLYIGGSSFSTPSYFNGSIYYIASHGVIRSYPVSNGTMTPDLPGTVGTRVFPFPGGTTSISANGTTNGIAWAIQNTNTGPAILVAWNATNLSTEIYNTLQSTSRDHLTGPVKFTVPTIANGKVYVGSQFALSVFGLLGGGLQFSASDYGAQQDSGSVTITVNRISGSSGAVQVNYATTSGGTAVDGQDYVATNGTLSWNAGETNSKTFNVTLLNSLQSGTNKTIFLTLSNATGGAYLAMQSTAVVTITNIALPPSAYAVWKSGHFGTNADNPAIAGDSADPDGDGIANILEYAFGSDPNLANTNRPLVGATVSNQFQLQFNRNLSATDLTYSAQAAFGFGSDWSNIMTFLPNSGWHTNFSGATVIESDPIGSPPDAHVQVIITDPVDPASTNRIFQLRIQQ
jgi:hypothetical protein